MILTWPLLTDSTSSHTSRSWVAPRGDRVGVHQRLALAGIQTKKGTGKMIEVISAETDFKFEFQNETIQVASLRTGE